MGTSENLMIMVNTLVVFVFFAWVFKVILDSKKLKHKSALHHKLVEKFGNVEELNDFLKSENGSAFFKSLSIEGIAPKEKLLSTITKGIVSGFLGLAFILIGQIFTEEAEFFNAVGIIIIALGLGFLVSSFVSVFLSKKWGILEDK